MNTISIQDLITKINAKKNGRIGTIEYYSVKDTINKDIIYKVTKTQFHKVKKENAKGYVKPKTHRTENATYLVDNWLREHNNTHNKLLWVVPFNSKCHKTLYYDSNWNPISKELALDLIKEKPNNDPKPFYQVKADQVIYYK